MNGLDADMVPGESAVPATDAVGQHPMLFVQALKGAPASVLLALAVTGRFMSHKELQLWTRCGKNQVTFALQALTHLGWVMGRTFRGPWALARPLAIPSVDLLDPANPFKGLSSSSDSLNTTQEEEILQPSPRKRELIETMYAAGIREPTATELAELPHVTLEYLQAHIKATREHGLLIGAAIQAMRLQAPPPHKPSADARQQEVDDMIRRFREGR